MTAVVPYASANGLPRGQDSDADAGADADADAGADMYATAAEGGSATLAIAGPADALVVTWANAAAVELVGLTVGDYLGQDWSPDGSARSGGLCHWTVVVAEIVEALADHEQRNDADRDAWRSAAIDAPDRSWSPVQVRVRDVSVGVRVVWLRPVTDAERLAEEARQESEHRFSALAEHAPVGIVVSEAGLRLGYVNNRFADITGIDRTMLAGTHWLKTVHPEDLPGLLEKIDDVLAGSPVESTVRIVSVSDSQRWVQFRLSPVTTPRRSAGFIGTVEDITARRAWERQLTYQADHDALTGLANRRSLIESLTELMSSRRARDRDAAVLFCDLDGFKQINDTLGHDAGDRVLIEVGQRIASVAREQDLVARIAGDEFVVIIREVGSYAEAEAAVLRQLEALLPPMRIAGEMVLLSASVGIAMARDHDDATSLLQAADRGMYEAKRAGRGQYRRGTAEVAVPKTRRIRSAGATLDE